MTEQPRTSDEDEREITFRRFYNFQDVTRAAGLEAGVVNAIIGTVLQGYLTQQKPSMYSDGRLYCAPVLEAGILTRGQLDDIVAYSRETLEEAGAALRGRRQRRLRKTSRAFETIVSKKGYEKRALLFGLRAGEEWAGAIVVYYEPRPRMLTERELPAGAYLDAFRDRGGDLVLLLVPERYQLRLSVALETIYHQLNHADDSHDEREPAPGAASLQRRDDVEEGVDAGPAGQPEPEGTLADA